MQGLRDIRKGGGSEAVDAFKDRVAEPEKCKNRFAGARDFLFDFFREVFNPRMQGDTAVRQGNRVAFRDAEPFDINVVPVEEFSGVQAVGFSADTGHFVERKLHFKTVPHDARRHAARRIPLFQHKY